MQSDSDIILCDFIFKVAVRKTRVRRSSPHSVYTSVRLVGITRWTHPTSDIHGRIWPLSTSAKKSCVCVRLAIASASGRGKFTSPGAEPRIPGGGSGAEPRGFFLLPGGFPGWSRGSLGVVLNSVFLGVVRRSGVSRGARCSEVRQEKVAIGRI